MKKIVLNIETDYDYDLIGFCSHYNDYRVCWAINENLQLNFTKSEEAFMVSNKKGEIISSHSFYQFMDEKNSLQFYLIQNKSNKQFLIPELAQIDYFIVVKDAGIIDVNAFIKNLKNTNGILTALSYDPSLIKSSKNLIF